MAAISGNEPKAVQIRGPKEQEALPWIEKTWLVKNIKLFPIVLVASLLGFCVGRFVPFVPYCKIHPTKGLLGEDELVRAVCGDCLRPPRVSEKSWLGNEQVRQYNIVGGRLGADDDGLITSKTLLEALEGMQHRYFEVWLGTWPDTIDWTGAVVSTHLTAAISSLSDHNVRSVDVKNDSPLDEITSTSTSSWRIENEISRYFTQTVGYYFGQDAFGIRLQAYDDMLWVVLGWLESIRLIDQQVKVHDQYRVPSRYHLSTEFSWYGLQFVPAFAHRARLLWDSAHEGWDTELCGGGMIWDSHSTPYKNAITNELYISASIGMYLYHPGDPNDSPFFSATHGNDSQAFSHAQWIARQGREAPYGEKYLVEAIKTYEWLNSSNMINAVGLYTDGFHIHDYGVNGTIGTGKCDERNEMVYTYNQGVLLSGLRGLWEATGNVSYLTDAHGLVRNVIGATGWDLDAEPHIPPSSDLPGRLKWRGLGRAGILEEACDARGDCDQNGQTFKGIFFHHLTLLCEPLPAWPKTPGKTHSATKDLAALHRESCREYAPWVTWNAKAALRTRDWRGDFGMWWTAGVPGDRDDPVDMLNLIKDGFEPVRSSEASKRAKPRSHSSFWEVYPSMVEDEKDPNARGRGRTIETYSSGIAVIRAALEFSPLLRNKTMKL